MSTRLVSIRYAFLRKSLCGRIAYCGMFEVKSRALAEASNGQADKQCLTNPIYAPTPQHCRSSCSVEIISQLFETLSAHTPSSATWIGHDITIVRGHGSPNRSPSGFTANRHHCRHHRPFSTLTHTRLGVPEGRVEVWCGAGLVADQPETFLRFPGADCE